MIHPSHGVQIFVATKPVDFRKGHDGLSALVQSHLIVQFTCFVLNGQTV